MEIGIFQSWSHSFSRTYYLDKNINCRVRFGCFFKNPLRPRPDMNRSFFTRFLIFLFQILALCSHFSLFFTSES
eukprot:UN28121